MWHAKVLITVTLRPASAKTKPYVEKSNQPKEDTWQRRNNRKTSTRKTQLNFKRILSKRLIKRAQEHVSLSSLTASTKPRQRTQRTHHFSKRIRLIHQRHKQCHWRDSDSHYSFVCVASEGINRFKPLKLLLQLTPC